MCKILSSLWYFHAMYLDCIFNFIRNFPMFSESVLLAFLSAVLVPVSLYTYFLCCQLFIIYISLVANEHFKNMLIGSQRIWSNLWLFLVFEFYLGPYSWEIFSPRIEIAYSLFKSYFYFIWVHVLPVCVCNKCMPEGCGSQKRTVVSLELEL